MARSHSNCRTLRQSSCRLLPTEGITTQPGGQPASPRERADMNRRKQIGQSEAIAAFLAEAEKLRPMPPRKRLGILTTRITTDLVEGGQLTIVWDAGRLTMPMLLECDRGWAG